MTYSVKNLGILIIVLLLASSIPITYYVVTSTENAGPGILLTINLYDVNVEEKKLVDVTSTILNDPNVLMYLEVNAIVPPSLEFKEDVVTIIKANMKPKKTIFVKSDKLLDVSSVWVSTYISRNGNPEKTYSGLIIRLLIYNSSSGDVLFEVYDSISYKPAEITKEKSIKITMSLVSGFLKPAELNVEHVVVGRYEVSQISVMENKTEPFACEIFRELVAEIKPENMLSSLPSSYFKYYNNRYYVKTPVIIASNVNATSGTVSIGINIGMRTESIGVYPTFTTGKILDKILNGTLPSITLWKGSGFSWGGSTYYLGISIVVAPLESWWIWIWARPIYKVYKVYRTCDWDAGPPRYLGDDVENVITDVLTSGSTIQGGFQYGLPHNNLMQMFFNGTEMKKLQIPGTYTEDGDLDPGEYIAFEQIFPYQDTCGADFEIGIPAGAYAALSICALLGLSPGVPACVAAIVFASTFQISISAQGASIYVYGSITNLGDHPAIPGDYDVPEEIYMAISKYQYKVDPPWWCPWCGPCYYNVPAGIYFKCD